MDTTFATTAHLAAAKQRDPARHRKVYLDTYAKRRLPYDPARQPAVPSTPAQTMPLQVQSQPAVEPAINPVSQPPVVPVATVIEPNLFNYQPAADTTVPAKTNSHKSYLDTLINRHQAAVAAAPAAAETVQAPSLGFETESLLVDEPHRLASEERVTANLQALYAPSLTEQITQNMQSASASHIRTIAASALICGLLSVGLFTALGKFDSQPVVAQPIGAPVIEVEAPTTQTPSGTPTAAPAITRTAVDPSHPVRLVVSSIGVNAPVEGLGTTSDGLIAVPPAYGVVGWYNRGAVPGKPGPAVLVGHYAGGYGAVFDKLGNLNNGDLITTTNGRGESFTYRVTKKIEYEKDKVPMAELFKKSDDSRLEIITCAGRWQANTYNNRLVVSAELVR